mgnify:CR=1 FL=1
MEQQTIRIKYHSNEIEKLTYIDGKSDWIDLRSAEHVVLKKGDFKLVIRFEVTDTLGNENRGGIGSTGRA